VGVWGNINVGERLAKGVGNTKICFSLRAGTKIKGSGAQTKEIYREPLGLRERREKTTKKNILIGWSARRNREKKKRWSGYSSIGLSSYGFLLFSTWEFTTSDERGLVRSRRDINNTLRRKKRRENRIKRTGREKHKLD